MANSTGHAGLIDIQIVTDARDAELRLSAMGRSFSDTQIMAWLMAGVDPILRARTEARFEAEGDDVSGKWASLKPYTVDQRRSQGFPGEHPINVRTGAMKKHLLDDPPRVVPHTLGVTMWSPGSDGGPKTAQKVKTAQMGDEKSHTVARPVLGAAVEDLEAVLLSLAGHIALGQPGGASVNGGFA